MFIMEHFQEGGWGMWPILALLVITVWITFDRWMVVSKSKVDVDKLMSLLKSQIVSGNIQGAISTCQSSPSPVTRIIAAGLRRAGGSEHDVQQAMDEEALRELPKIEKRTGYLAMLGNLATLAGLLGTITGLIKSFAGVAGVDPSMKATMLSKGISEAMNCTAFGLGTGILGLGTYAIINGMTQGVLDGINQATVETLNLVPYIDLLTCMVAFLLITAVWSQLARLNVHQKGQGQAGEDTPPEKVFKLIVLVNGEGFNLVADQDQQPIPKKGESYDFEKLADELKKIKDGHPDKTDIQVASEDTIKFDTLVRTMDAAMTARFPDVSLIDAGGAGI